MPGMQITLALLSMALFVVGVVIWLKREQQREWAPPTATIPAEVYRFMERIRDRLFAGRREVRLTLFRPDPDAPMTLRPIARIGWGRPSSRSGARFQQGEGLAGLAADPEYRSGILVARIGTLGHPEKARAAHERLFRLSPEAAARLSDGQLRSAVLIASSLMQGRIFKGVLCIDSLDPALVPLDMDAPFWGRLDRYAAEIARALPAPQPQASREGIQTVDGAELEQVHVWAEDFTSPQPNLPGIASRGNRELAPSGMG